jgi:hypothetical protein
MLAAVDADAQRYHAQVLTEVHAVDHQRHQVQPVQRRGEQLAQRGLGGGDEAAADGGLRGRRRRTLDLHPDRFEPDRVAPGGQPAEHPPRRHPAEDLGRTEQLVGRHRHLAGPVGGTHPRPLDRHPPAAERDRAPSGAMAHRRASRVMPAPRPAHRSHVVFHQRAHHLQPSADSQRQQPFLHVLGDLVHRHTHRLRQRKPQPGPRHRLTPLVVLGHGGPLLGRTSWRKPDTYHAAGIERGTATSSSTTPGTTSATSVVASSLLRD